MRVFTLEYIRQILNSDSIFLAAKKKTRFKLKNQVGPFICNHREAGVEAAKQLLEYKFDESFLCNYDPHGILSKMRVKCKLTPYIPDKKTEIEQFSNQTEWLDNTLMETVKQGDTSHTLKIVNQEDKTTKRIREEGTYTNETTTETRFKIRYNKKPKLNPVNKEKKIIEVLDEENPNKNTETTTIIENEQEPDTSNTQMIEK